MSLLDLVNHISEKQKKPYLEQIYNGPWADFKKIFQYGTRDMFSRIEIETITRCNRRCEICPSTKYPRVDAIMDEFLFRKIIDGLVELDYKGSVSPHFYGEPLLDERLLGLIHYTRKKLEKSQIIIWTNGDLLTKDRFEELTGSGVDLFIVSQYDGKGLELLDELKLEQRKRILYRALSSESRLFNRGGLIKSKNIRRFNRCYYPSDVVVIDYQGSVVLCCNDYFSENVFGNVESERLISIWHKEKYRTIRKNTREGKSDLEICKICMGKF